MQTTLHETKKKAVSWCYDNTHTAMNFKRVEIHTGLNMCNRNEAELFLSDYKYHQYGKNVV